MSYSTSRHGGIDSATIGRINIFIFLVKLEPPIRLGIVFLSYPASSNRIFLRHRRIIYNKAQFYQGLGGLYSADKAVFTHKRNLMRMDKIMVFSLGITLVTTITFLSVIILKGI